MTDVRHARSVADLRGLRVARVRSTLNLNRQQQFLDAHFLSLKASRLETMLAELDRRRFRVDGQLRETREALDRLLEVDRVATARPRPTTRPSSSRTMRIDY